jgi:excisionase family DNA binding protein
MLTVRQVAARLNVCRATVYEFCERGSLPYVRVGNCVRVLPEDLEAFIAARKQQRRSSGQPVMRGDDDS